MSDKQNGKSKSGPSSAKKIASDYQKAHKRAELERIRLQKEQERKEKLQEKERQRLERQQKKEAEEREKEIKRLKRLEEQRKRDEEKEAERKKKEEEKRKKEEERLQKEQERLQKEQERLQKEQEKKKEEESKTKREEKQRAVLLGFLVKGDTKKDTPQSSDSTSCGPFIQFQLRKDMRMAPLHRVSQLLLQQKRTNLDNLFQLWTSGFSSDDPASSLGLRKFGRTNYLHELQTGQIEPLSSPSTWPTEPPSIEFLGENLCLPINSSDLKRHGTRGTGGTVWLRAKLFQFCENYRPAYYGTWRRRSRVVTGRRPFAQDSLQLDYSVDSDDEWEEEEPGESITQSENEEEEEEKEEDDEDDDDDDRFFVPHGYLSDDEGVGAEDGDDEPNAQDMKRLRRCLSAAEYEEAHRRGLQRLKPILVGPAWLPEPVDFASSCQALNEEKENIEHAPLNAFTSNGLEKNEFNVIRSSLDIYRVYLWTDTIPIPVQLEAIRSTPSQRRLKKSLPEEAVPYLIHLVHKSPLGKPKLAFEFRIFWHRHTTGSVPECTKYAEYKRYTSSMMGPNTNRGPVLSGLAWDELALSQSLVLSSIGEIAVFEEGRWAVHTKVLQKYAPQLANVCGIKDFSDTAKLSDPEFLSNFVFPSWDFLSDVATITFKSNRMSSSKRRSLEVPVTVESVPVPKPTTRPNPIQLNGSPLVVLQPLNTPTSSMVEHQNPEHNRALKSHTIDNVPKHSTNGVETKQITETVAPNEEANLSTTTVTPVRKRVTLENFFAPPAKRSNLKDKTPIHPTDVSEDITIVIDSD